MWYDDRQSSQRGYDRMLVVSVRVIGVLTMAMDLRQQAQLVLMEPYVEFMERFSVNVNTQSIRTSDRNLFRDEVPLYFRLIINDRANPKRKSLTAVATNLSKEIHAVRKDLCRNNEPGHSLIAGQL